MNLISFDKLTYSDAEKFVHECLEPIMTTLNYKFDDNYFISGAYRRKEAVIEKLDVIVFNSTIYTLQSALKNSGLLESFYQSSDSKAESVIKWDNRNIAVNFSTFPNKKSLGAILLYTTGSPVFLNALKYEAKVHNCKFEITGLYGANNKLIVADNEQDIFAEFGLNYIPPNERSITTTDQFYTLIRKYIK